VAGLTARGLSWLHVAMKRVGIAELKNNLSRIVRGVEAGEMVEVVDRGRPIARIVPVAAKRRVTIVPAKRPFSSVRDRRFPPLGLSVPLEEILREERADRPLPGEQGR
jgi:prevent-host-death family protein